MHLTLISSLDALCRQAACEAMAAARPGAVVVLHDLLENGQVIRRVFNRDGLLEREETSLQHGCLSCTVRLDVVPTVGRLLSSGEDHVIIGLPPAVPSSAALDALTRGVPHPFIVDAVLLACAPDAAEDHIWDHHTLFESGFTAVPEDRRTSGEFLVGELAFADTVLLAEPDLMPVHPAERARGVHLLRELAPHAQVTDKAGTVCRGRHDYADALARTAAGSVRISRTAPDSPFTTVVHRGRRPLHPERFRDALAILARGCCWLRGRVWVASAPRCRIAVQGVGPRIWLENTGPWAPGKTANPGGVSAGDGETLLDGYPEHADHGTVLAATGAHVDAEEMAVLLADCELTDAEMDAGFNWVDDPLGLNPVQPS